MVRTRKEKEEFVSRESGEVGKRKTLIFTDYSGTSVNDLNSLRKSLDEVDSKFQVIKKRLLRVMFEQSKIDFNPETLEGQLGVVLSDKSMEELAGPVYGFASKSKTFKILGGFEMDEKKFMESEMVEMIGKLPSRDVLISQVVGAIAAPLRAFLYVLSEKSKQTS